MADPLDHLLARLAAAGVAEPSTLVLEFEPASVGADHAPPRTAMSSRVTRPDVTGARFHGAGLADGYVTYELIYEPAPKQVIDMDLDEFEQCAFGLRRAVDRLREQKVPVRRFVATGMTGPDVSIDHAILQVVADVLGERLSSRPVRDVQERGRAILAQMNEPGRFVSVSQAIRTLAGHDGASTVRRDLNAARRYQTLYDRWKQSD